MRYLLLIFLVSQIFAVNITGFFPLNGRIGLTPGYDSNVLRLSGDEKGEAALDPSLLGSMNTFDSPYIRLNGSISSRYRLKHRTNYIRLYLSAGYTTYSHTEEKSYSAGQSSIIYQWKRLFRIGMYHRKLNDFYLRNYLDRDKSNDSYIPCYFSDEETGVDFSYPFTRRMWVVARLLKLKRYYNGEFAEFDLDIYGSRLGLNFEVFERLNTSVDILYSFADNFTYGETARASSFDRSYTSIEWYLPVSYSLKHDIFSELGMAVRQEHRMYAAESLDDPLHSGRDHIDRKFDIWIQTKLSDQVNAKLQSRFRTRTTHSEYEWVEDLKSFKQVQVWMTFSRRLVYDRY